MERGELSNMQRDAAWEGKDLAERAAASALPEGDDPNNPTPEQLAFRRRVEQQKEQDENLGRGKLSEQVGRRATNTGQARQSASTEEDRKKERKEQTDRAILLSTLDQARTFADQRGRDADRFEDTFEARFGDAWREEIANRVMESDEIAERLPCESMEDYRERLTDELIDTMIDPETGEIRPEYANDPELREYAEWAKARYDEREARAYIERRSDPNLTPEQQRAMDEEFTASATWNEITQAAQGAARDGESIQAVSDELDARNDEQTANVSLQTGADAFL